MSKTIRSKATSTPVAASAIALYRDSIDAVAAGETTREGVRSESGHREELIGNTWTRNTNDALKPGESNAFRDAAKKDFPTTGVNRITDYSDDAWAEMYAESHSFYFTDSARFKLLRPHLHAYFATKYKGI